MSTARLLVDYGIGPVPAGAGGVLAYNDLDLPGRVPLTDRVGLGRILTLPHILETPIEVRIARRDTLTTMEEQTVARLLHGSFGSVLVVAGNRVEHASPMPHMEVLTRLTTEAAYLGCAQRATLDGDGHVAVRRAARQLIDGLELTGTQAADVLNAIPAWRARSSGKNGHTGNSLASAKNSDRVDENTGILGPTTLDEPLEWAELPDITKLKQMTFEVTASRHLLPVIPDETHRVVLQEVLLDAEVLVEPVLDCPAPTGDMLELALATRFVLNVVNGRYLDRVHPPRDRAAVREAVIRIQRERNNPTRESIARGIDQLGYLTRSGNGHWHKSGISELLAEADPEGARP